MILKERDKMDDKIQLFIVFSSVIVIIYFMYGSIIRNNNLLQGQKLNRNDLLFRQFLIILSCLGFSFIIQKGIIYLYAQLDDSFSYSLSYVKIAIFTILSMMIYIISSIYHRKIESTDERAVKIKQESTFNIELEPKEVKSINNYAHYFSGINYKYSPKDYTIQDVNINITKKDMHIFANIQKQKFMLTPFYVYLIEYLNEKTTIFKYKKIEKTDIESFEKLLDLKIAILKRFQVFNEKQYFASISQLYQIANLDEVEFLTFLRDFQHSKYSSLSLKHAIMYLDFVKKEI